MIPVGIVWTEGRIRPAGKPLVITVEASLPHRRVGEESPGTEGLLERDLAVPGGGVGRRSWIRHRDHVVALRQINELNFRWRNLDAPADVRRDRKIRRENGRVISAGTQGDTSPVRRPTERRGRHQNIRS